MSELGGLGDIQKDKALLLRRVGRYKDLPSIELPSGVDFSLGAGGKEVKPSVNRVRLGIPVDGRNIKIPTSPTVMQIDNLFVSDMSHFDAVYLPDVTCVLAHGYWDGKREKWRFADGQVVPDVVEAWERYRVTNNLPPLEFVIACNTQGEEGFSFQAGVLERFKAMINSEEKAKLEERRLRNSVVVPNVKSSGVVVESLGKIIWAGYFSQEGGATSLSLWISNGDFVNLDDLEMAKSIKIGV